MPFAEHPSEGLNRRDFLVGAGAVGAALLAPQVLGTRVAYAADGTAATATNTVITVFLRGGADGLRILAPNSAALGRDYLAAVRGPLVPGNGQLVALPGTGGWGLHAALRPLYDLLWAGGELAFVPAVSAQGVTRSHFQAEQFLEKGGSNTISTGWWDRVLALLGPGQGFRAVAHGWRAPASMAGDQTKLAISSLDEFAFPGWDEIRARSQKAVSALYAGQPGVLGADVAATMAAVGTAATIRRQAGVRNGAVYPEGRLSAALADLASILRAEVGLRVATVDVDGFDTHTDEVTELDALLTGVAGSLAAFLTDLGPARRARVTVVVQSEFGRRVPMNDSGGADHGTGGLIWLLGGGVAGQAVHGRWRPLTSRSALADGDVPSLNNVFDVLGEVVQKRLGVGSLATVFPGHTMSPLGVART